MGKLHNSILRGKGNMSGFIGEQIALDSRWNVGEYIYDYDMKVGDTRIDVKTIQTSVAAAAQECSIAAFNTTQDCDGYAFVRVLNDFSVGWFLGVLDKADEVPNRYLYEKAMLILLNYTVPLDVTTRVRCTWDTL